MSSSGGGGGQRLKKLLVNVKIERSLGPVQVIMSPETRVKDLIKAAVEIYVREKRRPFLEETDPRSYRLHYSQFTFQSLEEEEKLMNLESRNFFMCSKPSTRLLPTTSSSSSAGCSSEESESMVAFESPFLSTNWIDFLL